MTDTPRCNGLESNPLDSFDYRAWMTLARELECDLEILKAAKGYVQDYRATGPNGEPVAAICALDGCALMHEGATRPEGASITVPRETLAKWKDAIEPFETSGDYNNGPIIRTVNEIGDLLYGKREPQSSDS